MKKVYLMVLLSCVLLVSLGMRPMQLQALTPPEHDKVAATYHETMSKVKTEWNDTVLSDRVHLKGENGLPKAYLYRVHTQMNSKATWSR